VKHGLAPREFFVGLGAGCRLALMLIAARKRLHRDR
jgi:hypothetical protein